MSRSTSRLTVRQPPGIYSGMFDICRRHTNWFCSIAVGIAVLASNESWASAQKPNPRASLRRLSLLNICSPAPAFRSSNIIWILERRSKNTGFAPDAATHSSDGRRARSTGSLETMGCLHRGSRPDAGTDIQPVVSLAYRSRGRQASCDLNVIRDLLSRLACPTTDRYLAVPDLNVVFPYDEAHVRAGLLAARNSTSPPLGKHIAVTGSLIPALPGDRDPADSPGYSRSSRPNLLQCETLNQVALAPFSSCHTAEIDGYVLEGHIQFASKRPTSHRSLNLSEIKPESWSEGYFY